MRTGGNCLMAKVKELAWDRRTAAQEPAKNRLKTTFEGQKN